MTRNTAMTGQSSTEEGTVHKSSRSDVFNRSQHADGPPKEWYKFSNKSGSDTTEIEIMDEIGGWWGTTAADFVNQLKAITTPNITLLLNSPGGEVFDGVAIHTALKDHDAHVTVKVTGLAASAASFIAQAGDEIVMSRGSTMMIHDGLAFCVGNEQDMRKIADTLNTVSNNIAGLYADRAGGTPESWRDLMREEVWYTAQEAVDAGLADRVAENTDPKAATEATNRWDLSVFNHAGRADAPAPSLVTRTIMNRSKENAVTQPKNDGKEPVPGLDQQPNQPGGAETQALPEVTEPETPGSEEEAATQTGDEVTVDGPNAPTNTVTASASTGNSTGPHQHFMVNGAKVTDVATVQRHIVALETFQRETRDANRTAAVANLVRDKKMLASNQGKAEAFVLGLDDDQFTNWLAMHEDGPSLPQLGRHTGIVAEAGGGPVETGSTEELDTLKEIVASHKAGGMKPEAIHKTGSYKALIALDPTFKL